MMLTALLLVSAIAANDGAENIQAGPWVGRCAQTKKAQCTVYEAEYAGPVTLRFKRDSSTILITTIAEDCTSAPSVGTINPTYSAPTMTHMMRGHVVLAMHACKSTLPIPKLLAEDTAELLRQTDGVKK